jgi:hypothetical protein
MSSPSTSSSAVGRAVSSAPLSSRKPTARLVNTSRGPIVVEADLIAALKAQKIASAAIDVFDQEPLPLDHPFRTLANLLATPHIGYVSRGLYGRFYQDTVENIRRWLGRPGSGLTRPVARRWQHLQRNKLVRDPWLRIGWTPTNVCPKVMGRGGVRVQFTVGLKLKGKTDHIAVEAEDARHPSHGLSEDKHRGTSPVGDQLRRKI